MASIGSSWQQLRQKTRSAETQTEQLFNVYSQYSSTTTLTPKASEEELSLERRIQDLLKERESLLEQLGQLLESESVLTSSALKQSNLSRHREVLREHRSELARLRKSISEARSRHNLLSDVRSDIQSYRSANPEADYMLGERNRIERSHSVVDGVLSQAYDVSDQFATQRETLASINRRIVGAASSLPGINQIMNKISSKKRRDGVIMGVFIAICFLLVLYFR